VRPGLAGSYAATFHAAQPSRFLLVRDDGESATQGLREPRIERAIGVIYLPETDMNASLAVSMVTPEPRRRVEHPRNR
jgi:hypothetical protein